MVKMEPEGDAVVPQHGSRPSFGRGLSRQYSLYPSRPSLKSWRGVLTVAIDTVKFLYTNDFTRYIYIIYIYMYIYILYVHVCNIKYTSVYSISDSIPL